MGDDALKRAMAKKGKADEEDGLMEATLRGPLRNSAAHGEWLALMCAIKGWARSTFNLKLVEFKKRHPELAGGRWQSDPYSLPTPPTAAMIELVTSLSLNQSNLTPFRKSDRSGEGQGSLGQSDELARLKRQLAGVV